MTSITIDELLEATGGNAVARGTRAVTAGLTTDSRAVQPGCIFLALCGERFDGNAFAADASRKGAAAVVVSRPEGEYDPACTVVQVADTLAALQSLAKWWRGQLEPIRVVGLTGSSGKTSTKDMTLAILRQHYNAVATRGNLNNHIGVPLTLLSIKPDDEIAIVEMGANHPGEIAQLCQFVEPTFGLITNIGTAHIEGFGSQENIIKTKSALYEAVRKQEGTLFVNADDELLMSLTADDEQVIYYGHDEESAARGEVVEMNPYLKIRLFGQEVETHLTGKYNLNNMLAAAAVGHTFGVAATEIAAAIANYNPSNNRSQIIKTEKNTIIADFYNASPTSMTAALHNLAEIQHPHKMAILGEMRELGSVSTAEHKKIMQLTQELNIQALFVGEEFQKVAENELTFKDTEALNLHLQTHPIENAMLLVKGSRGIHLEKCAMCK